MIFLAAHIVPILVIFASNTTVLSILVLILNFHDSKYEPENLKFRPFPHRYEQDDQLFQCFIPAVPYHICTHACTLPVIHKPHFYCFLYKTMLIYAYYTNLMSYDNALYVKCHSFHNDLYNDVLKIIIDKLGPIYGIPHLRLFTILK